MKLFILLSRFPYPLEKGDKLRAYHQIKILSEKHEIHLTCLSDCAIKKEWERELDQYCSSVHVHYLSKPLIYWNTAKKVFSDQPFQVGYFYQNKIQRKIKQQIQDLNPDHIYCQLIRTASYVKDFHNIPKTLDYMDALSMGMIRRSEISKGLRKSLFKSEGKRLREFENRIFDYFNAHTIISLQDRSLINHPQNEQIQIVENGISADFFNFSSQKEKVSDIVFTGNMSYPPNIECCEYLINEIKPLLDDQIKITLSGAAPAQRIYELKQTNVEITGWVDDIKTAYASAKIFVAPLFIGTGLQNKLLEAMAIGLPCVTTKLANNALGAKAGQEILIAENANEFAAHIQKLLSDKAYYNEIANAGQKYVQANFSWEQSVLKLDALITSD